MQSRENQPIEYELVLGEEKINLTSHVGKVIGFKFTGNIHCTHCGKKTKKSYSQGYCYPCTLKLAECDLCILRPETCHFEKGTCRQPEWGQAHCMQPHIVYLANSSGLKIGITRKTQIPTRWIDQGATQALAIMEVKSRLVSGLIEVLFKKHISDKTDWRKMLKGVQENIDLALKRDQLLLELESELKNFDITYLKENVRVFDYPVLKYHEKINSIGLDKQDQVREKLIGIKGQYLILESGVFNVRAHTGHEIIWENLNET